MRRLFWMILVLCALTATAAACGGRDEPEATAPAGGAAAATQAPTVAPTTVPTAVPTPTPEPAEENLPDALSFSAALDELGSYRYTMTMRYLNTAGEEQGAMQMSGAIQADPPVMEVQMEMSSAEAAADPGQLTNIRMVQTGGVQYMFAPGFGCITTSQDDGVDGAPVSPEDVVNDVRDLKRVRPNQTINGVEARRYTFKTTGFAGDGLAVAEGELFVAERGGYLVRMTVTVANSSAAAFGLGGDDETERGTVSMQVDYFDVGKPVEVTVPEECANAGSNYPQLDDAFEVSTFGEMVAYKSKQTVQEAIDFYTEALTAEGYAYDESASFTGGGFANLVFKGASDTLSVLISEDASSGATQIAITKQP